MVWSSSVILRAESSSKLLISVSATTTLWNRRSAITLWRGLTPTHLLAGALVAQFQLVGRSHAGRLFDVSDSSPLLELRVLTLGLLSFWLFVVAAVREPACGQLEGRVLSIWRNSVVIFLAYMIFTTLWAPGTALALTKAYDLALLAWACALAMSTVRLFGARAMITGFWMGLFVSGAVLAVLGVITSLSSQGSLVRIAVLGGGPNVYGRNMGLLTIASLYLAISKVGWIRYTAFVSTPIAALLVLQTGSRGAMLAVLVGVVVLLWVHRLDRRVVYSIVFLGLVAATSLATQFGALAKFIFHERFVILLLTERYYTHRDVLLLDGLMAGMMNPIGGLGLAGFAQLGSPGLYPHNFVVEALAEGGLIGLTLLVIPFFYYVRRWSSGMTVGNSLTVAGLCLVFVSSSISGDMFDARGVFLLLLMALASQVPRNPESR